MSCFALTLVVLSQMLFKLVRVQGSVVSVLMYCMMHENYWSLFLSHQHFNCRMEHEYIIFHIYTVITRFMINKHDLWCVLYKLSQLMIHSDKIKWDKRNFFMLFMQNTFMLFVLQLRFQRNVPGSKQVQFYQQQKFATCTFGKALNSST